MRTNLATLTAIVVAFPAAILAQSLTATEFTFQGQLKQAGVPITGEVDIMFRLFDAATDGTQVGSTVGVSFIDVMNGLFTVQLDFGAEVFDGSERWLEVEVEFPSGVGNWTTLSPRQPFTATPYALQTRGLFCDSVGEVGIGTTNPQSQLHVVGDQSRVLRVRNTSASGGVAIAAEAIASSGYAMAIDAYTASPDGSTIYAFNEAESGAGRAIIGETASPSGIAIYGHAANSSERSTGIGVSGRSDSDYPGIGVFGSATNPGGTTYGVRGEAVAGTGVRGDHLETGNYGSLGTSTAGVFGRTILSAQYGVRGHAASAGGYAGYFTGGQNYFENNVGIGIEIPVDKLHVAGGDVRVEGDMQLFDGSGHAGIALRPNTAAGVAGEISLFNDDGHETVEILAAEGTTGGEINLRRADGTRTIEIDAQYGSPGGARVVLTGGADNPALYAGGSGAGKYNATFRVHNTEPNRGMAAYLTNSSTYATMHIQNDGPGETLWLENGGGGDIIVARTPERWQFWVDGDGITNCRVLKIHGGADLSEGFDVRGLQGDNDNPPYRGIQDAKTQIIKPASLAPAPGMVVSIDPESPGKLAVSAESYDRKVAGIISGAGGVNPGMLMGQSDSQADGAYPVALTGRVYCLCDASKAPIIPGDLLTTSELPGHAMKVADYGRAQGAIIGKAMTSLSDAQGLVLVLVSLQ